MTVHPERRIRRLVGLIGWTSIDQALFTLSNLVVMLAVARGGGTEALGRFSVAFAAYLVVLCFTRALIAEPLLARAQGRHEPRFEAASTTLTVLCAGLGGLVMAVPGLLLGRPELVVMAVALPVTLVQDVLRYQAFRRRRPDLAARLDGGWLIGSIAGWPVVVASGSPTTAVACWAAGALLGIAVGWHGLRPRSTSIRSAAAWWRREASGLAKPLLAEGLLVMAFLQALVFVVVVLVGDEGMGALRAGQVYFGPLGLALTASIVFAVPHLAARPILATRRTAAGISSGLAALAAAVCLAIVVAEPVLGRLLYAGAIDVPMALLVPLACQTVLLAGSVGLVIVARVDGRGADIVRSRLASVTIGLTLLPIATITFGLAGAVWSLVAEALWFTTDLAVRTLRGTGAPHRIPAPGDYIAESLHFTRSRTRSVIVDRLQDTIRDVADRKGSCHVLEVSAGHGTLTDQLIAAGATVEVMEMSAPSAEELRRRFRHNSAVSVQDDSGATAIAPGSPVDVVLCLSVLHRIPDYLVVVQGMIARISRGGAFVSFQDPLWCPRHHVVRGGVDELALLRLLQTRFDSTELVRYWSTQSGWTQALGSMVGSPNTFGVIGTDATRTLGSATVRGKP